MTFDFIRTAERLRAMVREAPPSLTPVVRHAAWEVESELCAQAVLYLYDHLYKRDQFAAAAHLLAHALPVCVAGDPRIREIAQHAAATAARFTPDQEIADARAGILEVSDDFMRAAQAMTARSRYWLSCVRVSQARLAVEYGSGCGSNVLHCAQVECGAAWAGVDASTAQVEACREQAKRLGINVGFAEHEGLEALDLRGKADCVGVLHVLEHTAFPGSVLAEAEKYVKPGGTVCVVLPCGPGSLAIPDKTPEEVARERREGSVVGHVNVTSLQDLIAFVVERGRLLDARVTPSDEPYAQDACVLYAPGVA